jgi:hypothetical protein
VYLPDGGTTSIDLGTSAATYSVRWFDPRLGGALQAGSVEFVTGPGDVALGAAPGDAGQDWAVLLRRVSPTADELAARLSCLAGPAVAPGCADAALAAADVDGDGDVDLHDAAAWPVSGFVDAE